ncbi:MAG: response regulator [Caldilineaceae bacterium]
MAVDPIFNLHSSIFTPQSSFLNLHYSKGRPHGRHPRTYPRRRRQPHERITLSSSLKLQGHTVALAEDGEEALAMTRATPYDAVLLDIIMPGKDGYTVLQEMKQDAELREIPVIVISALDEIESAVRCIELGAGGLSPQAVRSGAAQGTAAGHLGEKEAA